MASIRLVRCGLAGLVSLVLVVTLSDLPAAAQDEEEWEPPEPPQPAEVAVSDIPGAPLPVFSAGHAVVEGESGPIWPAEGEARVLIPENAVNSAGVADARGAPEPGIAGRWAAGDLPVRVGAAPALGGTGTGSPPVEVRVSIADRAATADAGVAGVLVNVSRVDGVTEPARVSVEVDYSGFRDAYGGDWAARLRVVALSECQPSGVCATRTPLPTGNDLAAGVLAAAVPLAADGGNTLLAVTSGAESESGDYTATSLKPAATWTVSAQTGVFAWEYPLRMVPGMGGPEPNLALSYSSQAVDGLTSNTNNQGSWIGDGWDLWPGFIERSYRGCADDTDAVSGQDPNNHDQPTGDQCWVVDNATMSLNGQAVELVHDGGNRWRPVNDDSARIERLTDTGLGNGDNTGEYWKVTTVDGMQYFFGRNRRRAYPSDTVATNSTWTAPVYGNHPGEPCYQAGDFSGSRCTQAWRWNLDYVIDPHGNSMTLFYGRETGAYGRETDPDLRTTYHRGGYLQRIEYGTRAGREHLDPVPARVVFDVADRCKPGATCAQSNPDAWPDVPWDQYCTAAPCADQLSATFWTQKRLSRIRTQVWRGTSFRDVESWTLQHEYLDAGDSDGEAIPMWLKGITRTGHVTQAGGAEVSDPQIVFDPGADPFPNRVKEAQDGFSRLNRWRIRGIHTESGAYVGIRYAPAECTPSNLPTAHTNAKRCFPQWYAPPDVQIDPELHWFHKYVVEQISVHDQTGASPSQETRYQYLDDPAWRYADSRLVPSDKRTWAQWRGYSKVRVVKGVVGETQSATEYLYLRGMHGDRADPDGGTKTVSVTDSQGRAVTDHEAHNGFLLEETVRNGPSGAWVTGTVFTPWRHGPTASDGPLDAWLTGTATERTRTALAGGGTRWTRVDTTFDQTYGMQTHVDDRGDEATAADDTCTRYTYARNTSIWMVDRVSRTETVGVRCSVLPNQPGDVLADQRTFYDNPDTFGAPPTRGLAVKVQEVGSWNASTPAWVTTEQTTFDLRGRKLSITDPLGRTSATAYTPATTGPVTAVKLTNPAGHLTTDTRDPAWDLPTRVVDANGHVTDLTYDGLGRLTAVWLPGRQRGTHAANLQFSYLVRKTAPTAVTSRRLLPDGVGYVNTVALYDGSLRERQIQTRAPGGGRVIEDTLYDSRGLIEWESEGYYNSGNPAATLVGTGGQPQIPGLTVKVHDGAERLVHEIFKINGAEAWRTSYGHGGDRTHVTPPAGGIATTSIKDARDNVVALRQYHGPTPTGPYDQTTYGYNQRNELIAVTDPVGNEWSYAYDQRGRQVTATDPDKGTVVTAFDAADQKVSVTDERGVTLGYTYDQLGRMISMRDGSPTGPKRAEWVYDTLENGIGKLTRSVRYHDGQPYTTEVVGYTDAGYAEGNRVIIPGAEDGLAGTYTTTSTYRADGSPATTTLPAVGGLPSERLTFSYNDVGAPTGLTSQWELYTYSVTYNKLGKLTQRVLGPHGRRLAVTYVYDDATGRLRNTSALPELKAEIMDLAYEYNPDGGLVRIADSPGSATPNDAQCYQYDYLQRLVEAWTPTSGDCGAAPSVGTLGGPAAYWHSYGYDPTGNRLLKTVHGAGGGTTTSYTHPVAGTPHPHAVTEAETVGPAGIRTDSFEYDQAGNLTDRTTGGTTQSLAWDTEGRLASVTEDSEATEFVYDADGNRLLRRDATGKTLYLQAGQEVRYDSATEQVTGMRYYQHLDTVIGVRTPGSFTWLVADHHGTAEVAVRSDNLTVARRRTTPFGEIRGGQPAFWAGDKGFVGGTLDPTGFTHLGARLYDPALGRFISVDPLIDYNDPQQMHGYAYGNNAPPTVTDPNGLLGQKKGKDKQRKQKKKPRSPSKTSGSSSSNGAKASAGAHGSKSPNKSGKAAKKPDGAGGKTSKTGSGKGGPGKGKGNGFPGGPGYPGSPPPFLPDGGILPPPFGSGPCAPVLKTVIDPACPPEGDGGYAFVSYTECFVVCVSVTINGEGVSIGGGGFGTPGASVASGSTTVPASEQSPLSWVGCGTYFAGYCLSGGNTTDGGTWAGGALAFGSPGFQVGPMWSRQVLSW